MGYKDKIINSINSLYFDAIEDFKEAEAKIANDSKFRSFFAKKDYEGNIAMLKRCRRIANEISFPEKEIPQDDHESREIVDQSRECVRCFAKLCDSYIKMQTSLAKKASGEALPYKEYKMIYEQTMKIQAETNAALRELDLLYTDYTEDAGDQDTAGYVTYDMLMGGDED